MNHPLLITLREFLDSLLNTLKTFFERTANWVIELTWMKFFLFAILVMTVGAMTQDMILSSDEKVVVASKLKNGPRNAVPDTDIEINGSGIHIHKNKTPLSAASPDASTSASTASSPATSPAAPQETLKSTDQNSQNGKKPGDAEDEIHVRLPPRVSNEISRAIDEEIANANQQISDANEQEVATYRKEKSTWLMGLIMIILISLFGVKALMGGKRRAELKALAAQQNAERESLQRQVAEAKMQMMQAQIEPHFLFNTLASVVHLIETDAPRAAAMQRSLIQYLRAVIPQMRNQSGSTNLGRELDIVQEYLTLLKMRMEERLTFSLEVPEGLKSAVFPAMMLQTLVENSIKHGLEPKPEGGHITVTAEVTHNKLRVSVIDDGLGFGAVASSGTGLGLQNIRERLALLYRDQHQFIITPGSAGGVTVTIEIAYQFSGR